MPITDTNRAEYHDRGATLLEALLLPKVADNLALQAQGGVGKKGGPAIASPNVSEKKTIEVYGFFWPTLTGLHWGLTPAVEEATGKRLFPSYAYFRTYQQGDVCKVHIDRPSCEHSMSLTLAYADDQEWSLCVGEREWTTDEMRKHPITKGFDDEPFARFPMKPGDALIYKGVDYRHGRVDPNPNRWSAHMFLHWVDQDGPYAEWAFDKQELMPAKKDFAFPAGA